MTQRKHDRLYNIINVDDSEYDSDKAGFFGEDVS